MINYLYINCALIGLILGVIIVYIKIKLFPDKESFKHNSTDILGKFRGVKDTIQNYVPIPVLPITPYIPSKPLVLILTTNTGTVQEQGFVTNSCLQLLNDYLNNSSLQLQSVISYQAYTSTTSSSLVYSCSILIESTTDYTNEMWTLEFTANSDYSNPVLYSLTKVQPATSNLNVSPYYKYDTIFTIHSPLNIITQADFKSSQPIPPNLKSDVYVSSTVEELSQNYFPTTTPIYTSTN